MLVNTIKNFENRLIDEAQWVPFLRVDTKVFRKREFRVGYNYNSEKDTINRRRTKLMKKV